MTTTTRPEDCRATDCGDGYEARPSGDVWALYRDGKFVAVARSAWEAMKLAESLKLSR